jgi:hypothetical protein
MAGMGRACTVKKSTERDLTKLQPVLTEIQPLVWFFRKTVVRNLVKFHRFFDPTYSIKDRFRVRILLKKIIFVADFFVKIT